MKLQCLINMVQVYMPMPMPMPEKLQGRMEHDRVICKAKFIYTEISY